MTRTDYPQPLGGISDTMQNLNAKAIDSHSSDRQPRSGKPILAIDESFSLSCSIIFMNVSSFNGDNQINEIL
jgi:hypothetical protein